MAKETSQYPVEFPTVMAAITEKLTEITMRMAPAIVAHIANLLAFTEASWAPATSPSAHLLLTWVEKMIAGMANGQHRRTVRIAHTR